ncbi:hypothetical protein BKI51_03310 [Alphaproteobacteria bacterium AO1-B]|nr:hypothetical protein BKI51_03310 [Alphaproteobacteria bacterium AO1-B]
MQSKILAVYTYNELAAPFLADRNKAYRDVEPGAFAAVEQCEGFIARSGYRGEDGPASWGSMVMPKCWENLNGDGWAPVTLSLWTSIEALIAATYHGYHGHAYRLGHQWHIRAKDIPSYVLWWVPEDHRPDWAEAVGRYEGLLDNGPSASAFSFKQVFDPAGRRTNPDAQKVQLLAGRITPAPTQD